MGIPFVTSWPSKEHEEDAIKFESILNSRDGYKSRENCDECGGCIECVLFFIFVGYLIF